MPTDDEEASDAQGVRGIEGAWAGGRGGMDVTNEVLEIVDVSCFTRFSCFWLVDRLGLFDVGIIGSEWMLLLGGCFAERYCWNYSEDLQRE